VRKKTGQKIKTVGAPLAVFSVADRVCMMSLVGLKKQEIKIFWSDDGMEFDDGKDSVSIVVSGSKKEKIKDCRNFSVSSTPTAFVMTYTRETKKGDLLVIAKSTDLLKWQVKSEMPAGDTKRATVVYDSALAKFEMYRDGLFVRNQSTSTLVSWKSESLLLFTTRHDRFDSERISIIGSVPTESGMLVIYDSSATSGSNRLLQVGAALFDPSDPKRIMTRTDAPVWQGMVTLKTKSQEVYPLGLVVRMGKIRVYWVVGKGEIIFAEFPPILSKPAIPQYKIFEKFHGNPVLSPRHEMGWEALGTFNPGIYQDEDEVLHMFYRALGRDGISRIGYAKSDDGLYFDKRLPYPVFEPRSQAGLAETGKSGPVGYDPIFYGSGGGWCGAEDPRVVRIDDNLYMTYVAFEGWQSMRMALTYISVEDFKKGKWEWKKPIMISAPGMPAKNWLLFPEKINGKFAIIHSIVPKVEVVYFDDPEKMEIIKSPRPIGPQSGIEGRWDSLIRGGGPPPLKTELGWLLFYHAIEKKEPDKYKLGAMILDKDDPTKVLYRSNNAILYPEMWYENDGKPGVVYASGSVIRGDDVYIYYGGGDRVVCAAKTNLKQLLDYLRTGKPEGYKLQTGEVEISEK
jgi:predicted GH43/DUF377 family glycosyl hydrolase